jgi:AraC-like DNA-binding protein
LEKLTSIDNQFLVLVSQIVDANLGNEHFSVEDLARRAGLSRSMLHRKLKKLTGKSAGDFITEIRLTRAKVLLENDAATVSEIAYRVGFTDPSYLLDLQIQAISPKFSKSTLRYCLETLERTLQLVNISQTYKQYRQLLIRSELVPTNFLKELLLS